MEEEISGQSLYRSESMDADELFKQAAAAEANSNSNPNSYFVPTRDFSTDEGSSVAFSNGPYQVIEYDPFDSDMKGLEALKIEDNTPAAEAIRANANVIVSPFGKAARAVHMQSLRRIVKRATGATKSGVVRGKPPRIPYATEPSSEALMPTFAKFEGLDTVHEAEAESERNLSPISNCPEAPQTPQMPEYDHLPDTVVPGTVEASKKVLGAVDPHDLLKLLRWRRKKKGGEKQKKSYLKGKVIDGEHELYTLSIAVMIGVRTSISKTNAEINDGPGRRWVTPEDFNKTEKYEFRPKGGILTPPHQLSHTFKVKDYAPVAFAYLRRLAGVNEFDFLLSVCGNANFIEFISNAKSGQFFFYSSDGRFMIKTMTNAESKFLRHMLPSYFRHCVENPNTMITRFLGMYRVKLYHLRRNVKFVIMNSIYYTDKYLQTFYDLKGSSIGRDAKPGQAVKKDNDLRRRLPEEALALRPQVRSRIREQLQKDCKFLEELGVMDYSMLAGVHHVPLADDKSIATSGFRGNRSSRSVKSGSRVYDEESLGGDSVSSQHEHDTLSSLEPGVILRQDQLSNSTPNSPLREFANSDTGDHRSMPDSLPRRHLSDNISALFAEDGLDEDDSSYLLGSEKRPIIDTKYSLESERKKQQTVEKLYWPFHRLYDIHGHRRLHPISCPTCSCRPCACHNEEDAKDLASYNIPHFVPPLSDRKDGGLEMDTTGFQMPLVYRRKHGPQMYGGKIFYMGIIDILQEYTSRKAVEAMYRMMQTHGEPEASCVAPSEYGTRFLKFFDEYTQGKAPKDVGVTSIEIELEPSMHIGVELDVSGEMIGSFEEGVRLSI